MFTLGSLHYSDVSLVSWANEHTVAILSGYDPVSPGERVARSTIKLYGA